MFMIIIYRQGRRAIMMEVDDLTVPTPDWLGPLLNQIEKSTLLQNLNLDVNSYNLRDCCKTFYSSLCREDVTKIILTCHSGSEGWKLQRKYRLTGIYQYQVVILEI